MLPPQDRAATQCECESAPKKSRPYRRATRPAASLALEIQLQSNPTQPRRYDAQRPVVRRPGTPAEILRRIAVEQVVDIEKHRQVAPGSEGDLFFDPQVGDDDVILAVRAERLGEETNAAIAQSSRERAAKGEALLVAQHRRNRD